MVGRSRLVGGRGRSILGLSGVGDISNITAVSISNIVVDSLDSAVRKSNRVGSSGGISITVLSSIELRSRVVISNSIVVGIHSGLIIGRLLVGRGMDRGMVGRGSMDNGSGMDNGSSMDNGAGSMDNWGSMVSRGRAVRGGGISRNSCRGSHSSSILLSVAVSLDTLGSSMRLAGDGGNTSTMGLVNSTTHRGSIANLDHLVVGLVSRGCSKEGEAKESLDKNKIYLYYLYNINLHNLYVWE